MTKANRGPSTTRHLWIGVAIILVLIATVLALTSVFKPELYTN